MVKKLLLGGMISAAMLAPVFGEEKAPAKVADKVPAAPAKSVPAAQITLNDLVKGWPENLASYDGKILTTKELVKELQSQLPGGQLPPGITGDALRQFAPELIKGIITKRLILGAAEKAGIKPSEAMAKEMLESQLKSAGKEELAMLDQMLAAKKTTLAQYVAEQSKNPEMQEMAALETFMTKYVVAGVKVTEADALKYYNENKKQFTEPADPAESMRASHILIALKKDAPDAEKKAALDKANKILADLKKNPASFETLAKENSSCPSSRNGGSLGVFGKGQMVPEFEKAVLALKPGEISGVVTTDFGYHIIRRDASQTGEKVISFDKVKDQLIAFLSGMEQQKALHSYVEKLLKESNYKLLLPAAPAAAPAAPAAPAPKK